MELSEAIETITADLVGVKSDDYCVAFMLVAFASPEELAPLNNTFDPEVMKTTLAAILADTLGVSHEVVRASIHTPLDVKSICARNFIVPRDFINSRLSRSKVELDNYGLAAAILAYGPATPRFGDAMAYIIAEGDDVPEQIRSDVTQLFKEAAISDNLAAEQLAAFD